MKISLLQDCPLSSTQLNEYIQSSCLVDQPEKADIIICGDRIPPLPHHSAMLLAIAPALPAGAHDYLPLNAVAQNLAQRVNILLKIRQLEQQQATFKEHYIEMAGLASLGELMADVIHGINNPLGIILGYTQNLIDRLGPEHTCFADLKVIEEETRRCAAKLRNLMEVVRLSKNEPSPQNLGDVLEASLEVLEDYIRKRKIQVVQEIENDLAPVCIRNLRRLLVIFLLVCLKKIGREGRLCIKAHNGPGTVILTSTMPTCLALNEQIYLQALASQSGITFAQVVTDSTHTDYQLSLPQWS